MRGAAREYGRAGLFGVLTPQGNPVAEAELRILLPPAAVLLAARMVSASAALRQRLLDYGQRLGPCLEEFGDIACDAIGIACTGASYCGAAEPEGLTARTGCPIVTAAGAIEAAVRHLEIDSIALASPYPAWLTAACRAHWERRGLRVAATLQLAAGGGSAHGPRGHGIYELTSAHILDALAGFDTRGAAGILLAGTGMPSLRVIQQLETARAMPVLSSNLCLAWALVRAVATTCSGPESRLYGGWAARLAAA